MATIRRMSKDVTLNIVFIVSGPIGDLQSGRSVTPLSI